MDAAVRAKILDVLSSQHMMALATIRPDGYPQATIVNYVHDGLTLYFASDAASQMAGNIKRNNKVSVVIANQTENFYKLSALSLSGLATRLSEKDAAPIALNLFRRLPETITPPAMARASWSSYERLAHFAEAASYLFHDLPRAQLNAGP